MAKQQQNQNQGKMQKAKAVKEGQVKKNKAQNTKNAPQDNVAVQKNGKNQAKAVNKNQKSNVVHGKGAKTSLTSKKNEKKIKEEEEEMTEEDSDEDINEGVVLPEDTSMHVEEDEDEDDDDSSSEMEEGAMKLLGESLAENTDSDDDDFDASEDEVEEKKDEKKGVKMFKGMKASKNMSTDSSAADEDDEDDEDDDEEEDDDDEEEDDDDESGPGLKTLMDSTIDDDDDDDDFDGADEDDEDEDIDESEEDGDNNGTENEMTESKNSPKKERLSPEEKAERDQRTIFIGNVPKEAKESKIRAVFSKFGKIETLRVRGIVPQSPKMSIKVAAQQKKIHPKVKTVCVFIVYEKVESAKKALSMNGKQFEGNFLRVDISNKKTPSDPKRTVFLGGLPFETDDNDLWNTFSKCGEIESVRTVRDRYTGACRGIGYVNFKSEDGVTLALDLNGTKISKREIRVSRYTMPNKTQQGKGNKRPFSGKKQNSSPKKMKSAEVEKATNNSKSAERRINQAQKNGNTQTFQGQKADAKNKGKKQPSKFEKKKKNMAGKLMSKPKKPVA